MDIPYNLIHELENEYGSINNVSEDNEILKSIRTKLHVHHPKHTIYSFDEFKKNKIIYYLENGYGIHEIAQLVNVSYSKVRKIMTSYNLEIKPKFKYVAIGEDFKIYSLGLNQFKIISLSTCSNFSNTKKALKTMGYELKEAKGFYHWCDLKNDDHYIINKNIYTKQ